VARRVEQRAAAALAAGHTVSAREAYLRAYVYNRAALGLISPFDTAAAKPAWQHAVDCFRRSAALADPVVEPVSVPCGDVDLPGYFVAAGTSFPGHCRLNGGSRPRRSAASFPISMPG
jgi:hypothetical protein